MILTVIIPIFLLRELEYAGNFRVKKRGNPHDSLFERS